MIGTVFQHQLEPNRNLAKAGGNLSSGHRQVMPPFGQPLNHGRQSEFHTAALPLPKSADRGADQHQIEGRSLMLVVPPPKLPELSPLT